MKNYLVTGGDGFIGSAIVKMLLQKGHKVISIDNQFRNKKYSTKSYKNLKKVKCDIRDLNSIVKYFKNIDSVFHLAFINGTSFFYDKPELVLDVGVKGILNVVDSCKKHNVKNIFLASSSEVYQKPKLIPTPEDVELIVPNPFNPRFSYGAGKIISEIILLNSKFFEKTIIFRPHNVYGPNMGYNHVIPEIIDKLKKSKNSIKIQGNGNQTRAFCYIDDFVNAVSILIEKGKDKNIYNIGNDEETKIIDVVKKIISISKFNTKIIKTKSSLGDTPRRCPNINKIKKLGFSPKTNLNAGLKKTYKWYLDQ